MPFYNINMYWHERGAWRREGAEKQKVAVAQSQERKNSSPGFGEILREITMSGKIWFIHSISIIHL